MKKTDFSLNQVDKLAARIDYQFKDPALLQQALTHCSAGRNNNERLEFLGDAVLGLIISDLLYRKYPEASEGELSRTRAALVQQSTLANIARSLHLGECLHLGTGELKTGGARRDSILADAMEALISAIYLDAGLLLCTQKIAQWFSPYLIDKQQLVRDKDAKTSLQEHLQARKLPLPVYEIANIRGKDHEQEFVVNCAVVLLPKPIRGTGASRKEAEQQAAAEVLRILGHTS